MNPIHTRMLPTACFAAVVLGASLAAQATTQATPVPVAPGWRGELIHHSDGGVWYAQVDKVVDDYGANEILAGDDKGRLLLLTVYSGQWTAHSVVCDGLWLAPTRSADVDPRTPGREIYAAGRGGSVHRVTLRPAPFARFGLESVAIGHVAGEEFHAVVAADLVPGGQAELLAFGISGAVYQFEAHGEGSQFAGRMVGQVPGRVRDVVLQRRAAGPVLYGVSRAGELLAMHLAGGDFHHEVIRSEDCGLGRIALGSTAPEPGPGDVLYATRDDGVVIRLQRQGGGGWQREVVFVGGQGLRGIAAGRFFADGREAFAVYGYDQTVHLVSRVPGGSWQAEVLLRDAQKGHFLTAGELDGRNSTDELVATGFDGKVFVLARAAGYGLPEAAIAPAERAAATEPAAPTPAVLRVAARLGERAFAELSPLRYQGGFETKALVYETLVQLDEHGRIGPGLASSYRIEDAGRTLVFALRDGATWHDGSPVLAAEVAMHFRRWVGLPEHGWLRSNARVVSVRASGERELRLELDRPAAVLADLCAINPTAVAGPATWSREGDFVRPVGSGPFVWQGGVAGQRLRYRAHGGTAALDLVHVDGDPLAALGRGEVDAVVGSWLVAVDPARVRQLQRDERFTVVTGPGSSVWQLELGWDHGPLATWARRAAVAASLDRAELIEVAAHGLGDPVSGYAAPSIVDWPAGAPVPAPVPRPEFPAPLRLVAGAAEATLVAAVCRQLGAAGIPVETVASTASTWDLRLVRTHGVPYDPFTFVERYGRPARGATAASPQARGLDAELATAIDGFLAATDPATWPQHYARVQARFDALLPMVPLFAPRRVAVLRRGLPPLPRLVHDLYRLDADWLRDAAR